MEESSLRRTWRKSDLERNLKDGFIPGNLNLEYFDGNNGLRKLRGAFHNARKNLSEAGASNIPIYLPSVGINWVPVVLYLDTKKEMIEFETSPDSLKKVIGNVKMDGRWDINVDLKNVDLKNHSASNIGIVNDSFKYLSMAVQYAGKLNILDGCVFFSNDDNSDASIRKDEVEISNKYDIEYRKFSKRLVDESRKINVTRNDNQFGKYLALEMPSGVTVAYNPSYRKGVYVVKKLDDLFYNKTILKGRSDVARINKTEGKGWQKKILDASGVTRKKRK